MPRIHHVNLSVPADGAEAEAEWLIDMLGYRPATPGPEIAKFGRLWWFDADDGHQIHLTPDAEHQAPPRAHTAVWLDDRLAEVEARLTTAGKEPRAIDVDGDRHVFVPDPAGNLWELVGPIPDA